MAIARGKFGIEYFPHPEDEESRGLGWLVVAIALAAVALVGVAVVPRLVSSPEEEPEPQETVEAPASGDRQPAADSRQPAIDSRQPAADDKSDGKPADKPVVIEAPPLPPDVERNRPQVARNLLLRLEKAVEADDVELSVSTIEQLRALPGEAVADLDDKLARQLGKLNVQRLFVRRNKQWVKEVEIRPGDSATRIAHESGSTLASLLRLNNMKPEDRIRTGRRLYVMDHPKFVLVVHRAARYADLSLKGKFFRRYDIVAPVKAAEGNYTTDARLRTFLARKGISFSADDRAELETLLPAKTPVLVSER